MNNYYVIEYNAQSGQRGCPAYFKGDLNNAWQWDEYDPNPDQFEVTVNYIYKTKHQVIDFDFGRHGDLVSEKFINLCNKFNLPHRAIPVEIIQSNGKSTQKKYFFLLCKKWIEALDLEKSEYVTTKNLESGKTVHDKYFPQIAHIEAITHAVLDEKKINDQHIFRCIDIGRNYVCSQKFKDECEIQALSGISFVPIDENFKMIPFWMQNA